jgi:hypothetical protein
LITKQSELDAKRARYEALADAYRRGAIRP